MTKTEKQLLWGLTALGLTLWMSRLVQNRRSEIRKCATFDEDDEDIVGIGAIPSDYKVFGKINVQMAQKIKQAIKNGIRNETLNPYDSTNKVLLDVNDIRAGKIVCTNNTYRHIRKRHYEVLRKYGWTPREFVMWMVDHCEQIRMGTQHSIIFVSKIEGKQITIALKYSTLIDDKGKNCWYVTTGFRRDKFNNQQIILWSK